VASALKGRVQGKTIVLDDSIPPLDGRRVLVVVEAADEPELNKAQSLDAWNAWVAKGPQGPIADDDEPSFP
jgi:hypothetical protein